MWNFLALEPEAFGLEISASSLKIVKLKRKKRGFSLASFGEQKVQQGMIENGEVKDEQLLVEAIKEGLKKVKGERIKTRYVVCSLPEEKSFLQIIQMPKIEEAELKKAVLYEAENYVPLPIEEVYIDSQIIPPVYNHLDHFDVLLVAFPKKIVDSYVACLKKAGLQPKVLELESLATARVLIKNEVVPYSLLIIDLGTLRTSIIIYSGYSLRFTTSISISYSGLVEAVRKEFAVSFSKAEKLLLKYGLVSKKAEGKRVSKSLIPVLVDLVKQVKKYVDYYYSHAFHEHLPPNERGIKKIILCGRGAELKGVKDFLFGELEIPVELGNPWINILSSLSEKPPLTYSESLKYTTALGLALRGVREKK